METVKNQFGIEEVLEFLSRNGKIKVDDVLSDMSRERRQQLLQKHHTRRIWQATDGRWCTHVIDPETKKRRKIAKTRLEDLEQYLAEFYDFADEQEKNLEWTLEKLYPEWLEFKKKHTQAWNYILKIEGDWKKYYVGTRIITIPLTKLTKLQLDEWAHSLIKDYDMSKNTYYNTTVIMRQALVYAVDLGIIPISPFSLVKIDGRRMFRKAKKKPSAVMVFSKEEQQKITRMAWEDYRNEVKLRVLAPLCLLFQLQTGVRIGEAVAVKFSDIETPDYIHIQRMLRRDEGNKIIPHTKTDCGDRQVLLTSEAKGIIAEARRYMKEHEIQSEFIFSIEDKPITAYCVHTLYQKYCRRLGIVDGNNKPLKSSHTSRRTFISALLDEGVNINTVREMAGHASEKTTLGNYCYDRKVEAEKRAKFEAALCLNRQDETNGNDERKQEANAAILPFDYTRIRSRHESGNADDQKPDLTG